MFINVHCEEMAKQWLSQHEDQTDVTYRITRGVPVKGQKVLYKSVRHCQHKRKQPLKPSTKRLNSVNRRDKKQTVQEGSQLKFITNIKLIRIHVK